jgi:hypothetical protein
MAKNCLNKLSGNILQGCTITPVGIKDIYLMHAEDVTVTIHAGGTSIASVVFASGAKSYKVEGYKQNIQYTASLKTMDASAKLNTSITFKMKIAGKDMQSLATGRFYVMTMNADGTSDFIGTNAPLECSAMDFDSNANARLVTVTLSDPEGSAGNAFYVCFTAVRDSIISKSV